MNKNIIISNLIQIAEVLDSKQMFSQAELLTNVMVKIAQSDSDLNEYEKSETLKSTGYNPYSFKEKIESPEIESKPELASGPGNIIDVNNKKFVIPSKLTMEKTFDGKKFRLEIDEENGNLYYIYREDNKPNLVVPVDKESGNIQEVRGKGRVDLLKMFGIDKIFGKEKLPRLSPVEQYFRRKVVPKATKVVKPLGNAARDLITRPLITDPLGAVADDLGLSTTGRDETYMADAKFQLGNSDDRSTVSTNVENSSLVDIKNESKPQEPTLQLVVPSEPEGSATTDGTTDDAIDPLIKSNGKTLRDIKNPKDLLFWSMMVANRIPFSSWSIDKEQEYYSQDRYDNTLSMINKLTSSNWVKRINPNIAGFKDGAISELGSRTANKTMNRQILASMNEICEELDKMDLVEASNEITKMMMKLAQENTFSYEEDNLVDTQQANAWTNFARSLAKKDPDFIPPIKPKASVITYADVTDKAISEYHLYKNNKKQLPKLTSMEENQLKQLAVNADRAK
jgi:hypothetical protein